MSRWIVSVDLGQTIDPTAIAVLEVTTRQDAVMAQYDDPPGRTPPSLDWFSTNTDGGPRQPNTPARIDVRHLERLPLRMPYTEQVAHVAKLLARSPLSRRADLVLDQTGVGRPVVDMFRAAGLSPIGCTITGGDSWSRVQGDDYRVAKLLLVSRLQAALHAGELRIAKDLPDASILALEMADFRAQIGETGYTRFGARQGTHDDLVLALAIGVWYANLESNVLNIHTLFI